MARSHVEVGRCPGAAVEVVVSAADRPVDTPRPRAGRDRLATVRADVFLDDSGRLTDEERALMAAMLRLMMCMRVS